MRTIWKFPLGTLTTVEMPIGARIVHADHQPPDDPRIAVLCLWAEVDPDAPMEERDFRVVGTGREIPKGGMHVHTWQSPPFVWHLYEVTAR